MRHFPPHFSELQLTLDSCVMIFFGGMIQIIAAVGEWIIGNTFSMCVFFTYGTFWIVNGTQLIPWFAVGAQYSSPVGLTFEGMQTSSYLATFGEMLLSFVPDFKSDDIR